MRSIRRRLSSRNQRGAVAVIFALLAVLMLSMAAIGVDLGNAMNRKKQTQTSADFAALAGAVGLPAASTVAADAGNASTVQAVADYINENQPRSDGTDDCGVEAGTTTVATLTDGDPANGEVTFQGTDQIRVLSPPARVQFGLATAMGFQNTCVQSDAVAAIKSGAAGMAPYYATASCSSGPQVLKSDAGGPSIPFAVPVLSHDAETNTSVLSGDLTPAQVPLAEADDLPSVYITVLGTNLGADNIDSVGFFNSDQTEPVVSNVFSSQAPGAISVQVPTAVQSRQDVWWVRVHHKEVATTPVPSHSDKWSARSQARPLMVGDAVLSCDPESSSGNFGSIDLPHGFNNEQDDLEANIRDGVRPPLTLKAYPGPPYPADDACHTLTPPNVYSTDDDPRPNTNCVESVPGLKAGPPSEGYLDASGGKDDGKFHVDTSQECMDRGQPRRDPGWDAPSKTLGSGPGGGVNADLLSCFLVNDTVTIADTIHYAGSDPLFVPAIWDSPRFTLVPILDHDPNGRKWMPILRFVPGFITDQPTGANRVNNLRGADTDNGLVYTWSGNKPSLRAIRIIFFDFDALPAPPDGVDLQDYIGSGPKVITLID